MKIGIFSKLGSTGGSEHRCAELANGLCKENEVMVLCEESISSLIRNKIDSRVAVHENVFKPHPLNYERLYEVDVLLIINTDCYSYSKLDYWVGKTKHHQCNIDVSRIPQMIFLYNYIISPAKSLDTIARVCPKVKIISTCQHYLDKIASNDKFSKIRDIPMIRLESPIDPNSVSSVKHKSGKVRIGKHSKAFGYKFNSQHIDLISNINEKYKNDIEWDFLGVPKEEIASIENIDNVTIRKEYSIRVKEYLQQIDIFLFFVSWEREEPWSRSVAEAMMSGCPILATNKAGNREQVHSLYNGFLCDSLEDFQWSIEYLIENKEMINIMGENSKKLSKEFTTDSVIGKLMEFIG